MELLGVLLHGGHQPAHYLLFEGQLQKGFKYPQVTKESWSSSALSTRECRAFVIFLVPRVGWRVPRDHRR